MTPSRGRRRPRRRQALWSLLVIALTGAALAWLAFAPLASAPVDPTGGGLVGKPAPGAARRDA